MNIKNIVNRIIKGMAYNDVYGSHPGIPVLFMLLLGGFFAGGFGGVCIVASIYVPFFLVGCYNRADYDEKD